MAFSFSSERMNVIDQAVLERHGVKPDEYDRIRALIGREPNLLELGLFSVMWSEHCSYKSSRVHLKTLPTTGPRVVQGPGENAGAVDIGDGMCAVFKIESHNHPSFIEPYQGAATGVGGIIRDIFTMGARPIGLLNALRFGSLETPLARRIFEGVVAGVGGYGNSIGIPTIGGEIYFDSRYAGNPLVNVLCLGLAKTDEIIKGAAHGVGNPVFYVGAKTGRDGIHGATMASAEFDEKSAEKRPAVQVGDPFMEKLLMEACLEVMRTGAVVGIQDMGAAGLTCSTSEMSSRGGTGMDVEVTLVPQRESGMVPYEIMLSESQERMLLVVERGREREVEAVFEKWDLHAVPVGTVTDTGRVRIFERGTLVADVPTRALTDEAPLYQRPTAEPSWQRQVQGIDFDRLGMTPDAQTAFARLIASPVIASKRWAFRQYDHTVGTNTIAQPGASVGVVRVKGTNRGLAVSVDCSGRFCYLDPYRGAMLAVAESARNVACAGGEPIGATNNLNFGNPERPEIMWQLAEAVRGIGDACRALDIPITGGNVSLYNETDGEAIYPTPVIGVVGLLEDATKTVTRQFQIGGRSTSCFWAIIGASSGAANIWLFCTICRRRSAGAGSRPPSARSSGCSSARFATASCARRTTALKAGWRSRSPNVVSTRGLGVTASICRRLATCPQRSAMQRDVVWRIGDARGRVGVGGGRRCARVDGDAAAALTFHGNRAGRWRANHARCWLAARPWTWRWTRRNTPGQPRSSAG